MSKQELIDLAIEYSLIKSTLDFNDRSKKAQEAILRTIRKIAGA